jgi:hypothetical protein
MQVSGSKQLANASAYRVLTSTGSRFCQLRHGSSYGKIAEGSSGTRLPWLSATELWRISH